MLLSSNACKWLEPMCIVSVSYTHLDVYKRQKQSGKLTSYPMNIWRNAMSRIHEGLETKDFVQPDGITNTTVCSKSGLVPLDGICDNDRCV